MTPEEIEAERERFERRFVASLELQRRDWDSIIPAW